MLKKVLMCNPEHFRVDYQINPWMKPGTVDLNKAKIQWQAVVDAYKKNGIEVEIIEQNKNQPDMVFAADQGLVINEPGKSKPTVLISNFRYPERQGETKFYKEFFEGRGYDIHRLPAYMSFEGGGEILHWEGKYFVGEGFRNSHQSISYLQHQFDLEFIMLELVNEKYYHLDTCMFVLDSETAFYYPPAFSVESMNLLKTLFKNLIEFSTEEVEGFAANSVVSGQNVFVQQGNPTFNQKVENMGYTITELDVSEFIKSGGGIHCLTFELERVPHFNLKIKEFLEVRGSDFAG